MCDIWINEQKRLKEIWPLAYISNSNTTNRLPLIKFEIIND